MRRSPTAATVAALVAVLVAALVAGPARSAPGPAGPVTVAAAEIRGMHPTPPPDAVALPDPTRDGPASQPDRYGIGAAMMRPHPYIRQRGLDFRTPGRTR
jgi:hypothetical protein